MPLVTLAFVQRSESEDGWQSFSGDTGVRPRVSLPIDVQLSNEADYLSSLTLIIPRLVSTTQ